MNREDPDAQSEQPRATPVVLAIHVAELDRLLAARADLDEAIRVAREACRDLSGTLSAPGDSGR